MERLTIMHRLLYEKLEEIKIASKGKSDKVFLLP